MTTTSTTSLVTTTTKIPASDEITCNFDKMNTCGWIDDTTSDLKWTLDKGSSFGGPTSDVSGSGYYIYIHALDGLKGDKARILSPIINDTLARNQRNLHLNFDCY